MAREQQALLAHDNISVNTIGRLMAASGGEKNDGDDIHLRLEGPKKSR